MMLIIDNMSKISINSQYVAYSILSLLGDVFMDNNGKSMLNHPFVLRVRTWEIGTMVCCHGLIVLRQCCCGCDVLNGRFVGIIEMGREHVGAEHKMVNGLLVHFVDHASMTTTTDIIIISISSTLLVIPIRTT